MPETGALFNTSDCMLNRTDQTRLGTRLNLSGVSPKPWYFLNEQVVLLVAQGLGKAIWP